MIAEPRSLYISLRGDAVQALVDLAVIEHRHPREQAAYLIETALEAQGILGPHPRRVHLAAQEAAAVAPLTIDEDEAAVG